MITTIKSKNMKKKHANEMLKSCKKKKEKSNSLWQNKKFSGVRVRTKECVVQYKIPSYC